MDESEESDEDNDMVDIGNQFMLHKSISSQLYDYQVEGVLWFWKLFKKGQGGILGDDMGLGKTIQVIAFLAGLFDAELIKHVLIVAPLSILVNWEKELEKWAGGIRLKQFHGNKKQRLKGLYKVQKTEGILITTYGMVVSNVDVLSSDENGEPFKWDYIILDEGHKIKNPSKTSKCCRSIKAKYHYILTGTPIQNNLSEMWSLFDFTQEGQLLGTKKTFYSEFERPIVRAREKDATQYEQEIGNKMSATLRMLIKPYFLRRTKENILKKTKEKKKDTENEDSENIKTCAKAPKLTTKKNDLIVWVYLSDLQLKLYKGFVQSERVKQTLMTTRSPLAELTLLKKISDHPRLQSTLSKLLTSKEEHETRLACGIEADDDNLDHSDSDDKQLEEPAHAPPVEQLIEDSGKMVFLVHLMENLRKEGHRTIIFSQSRKMLDIIQKVLLSLDHKMLRIDGFIKNPQDREKIIQKFQTDYSYSIMLMTTQVGSVGLTLTGADRLVIFDPSWNPGTDAQAVDRVYRLGQTRDVVVYRLITCGSIEEKIYRKQIFKNAVMKQTTGCSKNPYRYFTNQELRELFILDDPKVSTTQQQLEEMHPPNNDDEAFKKHLKFLEERESVFGVSHHDQLFSQEAVNLSTSEYGEEIDAQVSLATQRLAEEVNIFTLDDLPKRKYNKNSSTVSAGSAGRSFDSKNDENIEPSPSNTDNSLHSSEGNMSPVNNFSIHSEGGKSDDQNNSSLEESIQLNMKNLTIADECSSNGSSNQSIEDESPSKHFEEELEGKHTSVREEGSLLDEKSLHEDDESIVSPKVLTPTRRRRTLLLNASYFDPECSEDENAVEGHNSIQNLKQSFQTKSCPDSTVPEIHAQNDLELFSPKEDQRNIVQPNVPPFNENEFQLAPSAMAGGSKEEQLNLLQETLDDASSSGEMKESDTSMSESFIATRETGNDGSNSFIEDPADVNESNYRNSYYEVTDKGCSPICITPVTIRNLGKNYRTPPVSPLCNSYPKVKQNVLGSRLKSTPVSVSKGTINENNKSADTSNLVHRSGFYCPSEDSDITSCEESSSSLQDISKKLSNNVSCGAQEESVEDKSIASESKPQMYCNAVKPFDNSESSFETEESMFEVQDAGCSPLQPKTSSLSHPPPSSINLIKRDDTPLHEEAKREEAIVQNNKSIYLSEIKVEHSLSDPMSSAEIDVTELEETDIMTDISHHKIESISENKMAELPDTELLTQSEEKKPSRFILRRSIPRDIEDEDEEAEKCNFDFSRMTPNASLNPLSPMTSSTRFSPCYSKANKDISEIEKGALKELNLSLIKKERKLVLEDFWKTSEVEKVFNLKESDVNKKQIIETSLKNCDQIEEENATDDNVLSKVDFQKENIKDGSIVISSRSNTQNYSEPCNKDDNRSLNSKNISDNERKRKYESLMCLMKENMGNQDMDDHTLIDVVDLLQELLIFTV